MLMVLNSICDWKEWCQKELNKNLKNLQFEVDVERNDVPIFKFDIVLIRSDEISITISDVRAVNRWVWDIGGTKSGGVNLFWIWHHLNGEFDIGWFTSVFDYVGVWKEKKRRYLLDDFKSVKLIPQTAKLGKILNSGLVLEMNLNLLELMSVQWKGVMLGCLDRLRSK